MFVISCTAVIRGVWALNWLSNKVVDEWNGLINHIVRAETMGSFKRRLDKFMDEDDKVELGSGTHTETDCHE